MEKELGTDDLYLILCYLMSTCRGVMTVVSLRLLNHRYYQLVQGPPLLRCLHQYQFDNCAICKWGTKWSRIICSTQSKYSPEELNDWFDMWNFPTTWLQLEQANEIVSREDSTILSVLVDRGQDEVLKNSLCNYFETKREISLSFIESIVSLCSLENWNIVGNTVMDYSCRNNLLDVFKKLEQDCENLAWITNRNNTYEHVIRLASENCSCDIMNYVVKDACTDYLNTECVQSSLVGGCTHCVKKIEDVGISIPDDGLFYALHSKNIAIREYVQDTTVLPTQIDSLSSENIEWLCNNNYYDILQPYAEYLVLSHLADVIKNTKVWLNRSETPFDLEYLSTILGYFGWGIENSHYPITCPINMSSIDSVMLEIGDNTMDFRSPLEIGGLCPLLMECLMGYLSPKFNLYAPIFENNTSTLEFLFKKLSIDFRFIDIIENILNGKSKKEINYINTSTKNSWLHELIRNTHFPEPDNGVRNVRLGRMTHNERLLYRLQQVELKNRAECAPICYELLTRCLEMGASPHIRDKMGRSALHVACAAPSLLRTTCTVSKFENSLGSLKNPNIEYLLLSVDKLFEYGLKQYKDKSKLFPVDYSAKSYNIFETDALLYKMRDKKKKKCWTFILPKG
eukprot:TRINITY_DN9569_c0_g1_i1.p1 TRINITY_DN9569_c0_g1~~TRINITY_DN9569_c0_g1_i1.p1  ORF type:complete len:626 (+),score=83.62 TRINITY_DN9569_c0_g1_i1:16-1893(+)